MAILNKQNGEEEGKQVLSGGLVPVEGRGYEERVWEVNMVEY
jgi:hypothetical protein